MHPKLCCNQNDDVSAFDQRTAITLIENELRLLLSLKHSLQIRRYWLSYTTKRLAQKQLMEKFEAKHPFRKVDRGIADCQAMIAAKMVGLSALLKICKTP